MKLVILAATMGFVFGADDGTTGGDCGRNSADDGDVACAASGEYCDLAQNAAGTNAVAAGEAANTGICAAKIAAGAACVADGDCVSGDCDASTCRLADGATCTASGECLDASYCKDTDGAGTMQCAADEADDATCTVAGDCTSGVCEGPCGASLTCGANTNADGALGGCCSDSVAVTDSANYCASGTVTVKVADDGVCSVAGAGAECASGSCTATAATDDDADVGACDATATEAPTPEVGADGGACRTGDAIIAAVDAVTACGDGLTCDSTNAWCQTTGTTDPSAADSTAAAGALGGACTADAVVAVNACDADLECADSVCGAAATDAPTDAPSTDDSPAAIFYGLSMVSGAIAYLL